jgi:chitinase
MNRVLTLLALTALYLSLCSAYVPYNTPPVVAYVDAITTWWGCNVPFGFGLPNASTPLSYNTVILSFWTTGGPADSVQLWSDPVDYIPTNCTYGTDNSAIQQSIINDFHAAGINVLASAFGSTNYPTSTDPAQTCSALAQFILDNNLDGVDIDYEDTAGFSANGGGEQWLITCTQTLRQSLPQGQYLLTHAPQGPYFEEASSSPYPNGAYLTVDSEVGDLIDWYNLQYYNQGTSAYVTYEDLFVQSSSFPGSAVLELQGTLKSAVAVGKPVNPSDASNGYVPVSTLASWLEEAQSTGWCGGAMYWEYSSDTNDVFGQGLRQALNTGCNGPNGW